VTARCGWTGKLPASGDFVSRRTPAEFASPWQRWLDAMIPASRERLGSAWQPSFLSAPAWRFVLGPGAVSGGAWAGVMVPSVDSVGRYYPLTLVQALPGAAVDPEQTLEAMAGWFDMAEMLATEALSPATDPGAFDDSVAALPLPPAPVERASAPIGLSAWSTKASEVSAGWSFAVEGLPAAERFCEMLTGNPARARALS
jgi:type VI secretion system protein ImpM